jgi:hypothetical protein
MTAKQVEVYQRILEQGQARGEFELADTSESIARNLIALEDAYGLYIIGADESHADAVRQILSFASMATAATCADSHHERRSHLAKPTDHKAHSGLHNGA